MPRRRCTALSSSPSFFAAHTKSPRTTSTMSSTKTATRMAAAVSTALIIPDGLPHVLELLGIDDQVDLDDAPACDREADDGEWPLLATDDSTGGAVDERRTGMGSEPRPARDDLLRDRRRPDHGRAGKGAHLPGVDPEDDVRIEHREEPLEVTLS